MRIKTIICWLLCLCLAVGGVLPAAAASASAADMRLEKVEGTVKLENASGRKLSVRDGMKLYSGYTVKTEAKSYAYLMLDDEKAVKLDENSALEVRRDGKKLELLVTAGQIFFNVTAPLAKGESMNIRTSTMVTGIRGTAGYVSLLGEKSRLTILEGSAVMSLPDGSMPQVVAPATVGVATPSMTALETLNVADIPGFVAVELAGDPALARDVEAATGQSVADVLDGAPAKLQADQAASAALVAQNPPPVLNPTLVVVPVQIPVIPGVLNPVVPPSTPVVPPVVDPTPPTPGVTMGGIMLNLSLVDENGISIMADAATDFVFGIAPEGGVAEPLNVTLALGTGSLAFEHGGMALGAYTVSVQSAPTSIEVGGVTYTQSAVPAAVPVVLSETAPVAEAMFTFEYHRATTVTVTDETLNWNGLTGYFATYDEVVLGSNSTLILTEGTNLTLPSDKILTVDAGGTVEIKQATVANDYGTYPETNLFVDSGATMRINAGGIVNIASTDNDGCTLAILTDAGTLTNEGTINVGGRLALASLNDSGGFDRPGGDMTNSGTVNVNAGGSLVIEAATLTNNGTINARSSQYITVAAEYTKGVFNMANPGVIINQKTGTIIASDLRLGGGSELENFGRIELVDKDTAQELYIETASLENSGEIIVNANTEIVVFENNYNTQSDMGTRFINTSAGTITVDGALRYNQSRGALPFETENAGTITINAGATYEIIGLDQLNHVNSGTLNLNGTMKVDCIFTNNGTVNQAADATVTVSDGGTINGDNADQITPTT